MTPRYMKVHKYNPKQNPQNMNQTSLILCEFLKKLTQFLLSLSLFSFLFMHFSTLPSQFISHASDKNYIFLLFNGILVYIAKYSNRIPSEITPDNDLIFKDYEHNLQPLTENDGTEQDVQALEGKIAQFLITDGRKMGEKDGIFDDENNHDDHEELSCTEIGTQTCTGMETKKGNTPKFRIGFGCWDVSATENVNFWKLSGIIDEEYMEEKCENGSYIEEEEEVNEEPEDEEEEVSKMSTEELNRKFEDFIRKMKEELRIEAQQQLIMV